MKKTFSRKVLGLGILCAAVSVNSAFAAPINGDGNVLPGVIFGTGNANGSFTGVTVEGVELALRGKLRYNLAGLPENTFNYDGDHTYNFDPANANAPANRSIFNFEYSINTNVSGTTGLALNDLNYQLSIDNDPTAGTASAMVLDIINGFAYFDHDFGDNTTGPDGGIVATDAADYAALIDSLNVAQNSANLGFFFGQPVQLPGIYTISLTAFRGQDTLASTSIDVVVGAASAVPLPASLPLLFSGLAMLGLTRRNKKTA